MTPGDFYLLWFLRAFVGGFFIILPGLGPLFLMGMTLLSLWAYSFNPELFQYIFLYHICMASTNSEGELTGSFGLAIALIIGCILGAWAGDSFKNYIKDRWNKLKGVLPKSLSRFKL